VAVAATLAANHISSKHAAAITCGLADLSPLLATAAEPVALELASQLDPATTRRAIAPALRTRPGREDERAQRRYERRGLDLNPTFEGMLTPPLLALCTPARRTSTGQFGGPTRRVVGYGPTDDSDARGR
jgi:hypothetical protein